MPKFKVKSNVSVGTRAANGDVSSKDYKAGDTVELTEAQAKEINFALEDGPVDETVPESERLRPDHKDSGVAAAHKVDLPRDQVAASEAQARQNVLDSPSAENADGSPLAEDLEKGATENVAAAATPRRVAGGGAKTNAPDPKTTQPPAQNPPAPQ